MEKSWQIFGDYGVYETEKEQGLFPRLERALQKPDKVENCRVIVPSAPLRQLSIVIGNKELSEKRLTLNNTPFSEPRFDVTANLFYPHGSIMRDDGEVVNMEVVGFDAYEREGTGDICYSDYYQDWGRRKKKIGSVIVFKADVQSVSWWRRRSKLTVQDMKWGENCAYGACVTPNNIKWFRISCKDAEGKDLNPLFPDVEILSSEDERVAEANAELEEFLQERERVMA